MAGELDGLTALVTGASGGLGAQFARALSLAGAQVAVAARRAEKLEALAAELGKGAAAVAMDVADEGSIAAGFDAAERALGPVDVVINNAGLNARGLAVDLPAAEFDQVFAVNVRGVFLCAREAARRMIARGPDACAKGRIVNIASIGGLKVLPGLTAYCTSKAAVVMMSRSLAREWARHGINVNAVCPGYIETDINAGWLSEEGGQRMVQGFPRRRLMGIADIDPMIVFLAGPASAAVTGGVFTLDDGQSL